MFKALLGIRRQACALGSAMARQSGFYAISRPARRFKTELWLIRFDSVFACRSFGSRGFVERIKEQSPAVNGWAHFD
ncbi:MAG: hypothetical protein AAGG07_13240 [Planctomycetota bacterium]